MNPAVEDFFDEVQKILERVHNTLPIEPFLTECSDFSVLGV